MNNTYDVESDKKQLLTAKDFDRWNLTTKNHVALGNISKGKAYSFSAFLFCLSALYFYVKGGLLPAFFATAIFIWGWAYSAPPLKLKNRFLFGSNTARLILGKLPISDGVLHEKYR